MISRNLLSEDNNLSDISILIEDRQWRLFENHPEKLVYRALRATKRLLGADFIIYYPEFAFSTDRVVKKLNARFRNKNKPTNVLTFEPSFPGDGGSIILGFETIHHEAHNSGKSLKAHTLHLLVHGLLHLAGYDHHHPGEARTMEMLETRILRQMGLPDPWKCGRRTMI